MIKHGKAVALVNPSGHGSWKNSSKSFYLHPHYSDVYDCDSGGEYLSATEEDKEF